MGIVTIKNNYYPHRLLKKWQTGLETRYDPQVSHLKEVFNYDKFKYDTFKYDTTLHTIEKRYLYLIVVKEIPKQQVKMGEGYIKRNACSRYILLIPSVF